MAVAQTQPVALVPVEGVTVSGAIEVSNGQAVIESSGTVTAGESTAKVILPAKGELRVCSTTTVHLSRDRAKAVPAVTTVPPLSTTVSSAPPEPADPAALLIAFDRGALEASFATGKYSDVLMTPDFRILISGPGQADVRIRVSPQGDTCIDNRGEHAPYITVSSQLEDGLYRVQPNQRVLFEHGSLREVVDHEQEPCGCPPPPLPVASAGAQGNSQQTAATSFPLAHSEGLAPTPPPAPTSPGEMHTQVTVPLVYNGTEPAPLKHPPPEETQPATGYAAANQPVPKPKTSSGNVFHRVGRFFSKLFGRG